MRSRYAEPTGQRAIEWAICYYSNIEAGPFIRRQDDGHWYLYRADGEPDTNENAG
jgi:hypothetical protein